jgi:hypothetical protein
MLKGKYSTAYQIGYSGAASHGAQLFVEEFFLLPSTHSPK